MQFLTTLVRQAHPGERRGAYDSHEQKLADAREFQHLEGIAWPVLVDDLAGTAHRTYGSMSDPVYLLDATGRVAFYGMWLSGSTLKRAIDELLAQGGQGPPVAGGIDRMPHMAAAFVEGWRTMSRGGKRAVLDAQLSFPGAPILIFLGYLARPLLRPLAVRATPLPLAARLALWGGLVAAGVLAVQWRRRGD